MASDSIARTLLTTLRTRWRAMALPTLVAGFCTAVSFCLVPIPFALFAMSRATDAACESKPAREPTPRVLLAGLLTALSILPWLGSMFIGVFLLTTAFPSEELACLGLQAAVAVVGTAAVAPWLGAAALVSKARLSAHEALARSLSSFLRGNALRVTTAAAFVGLLLSIPVWLLQLSPAPINLGLAIVGSLAAWMATIAMSHAVAAIAPRPRRSVSAIAVLPIVAALAAIAVAAAVVPPAWEPLHRLPEAADVVYRGPTRVGEIELEVGERSLEVRGRAGAWRLRPPAPSCGSWYASLEDGGDVLVACVSRYDIVAGAAHLAPDGTWRRDTVATRISARVGLLVVGALALSLLCALACIVQARRRTLFRGPSSALLMRLRLDTGASLAVEGEALLASGGVRFESPDGLAVLRLDGIVASTSTKTSWAEGDAAHVIVPGHIDPLGFRTGAAVLPTGAWISDEGDAPDDARTIELARAIVVPALAATLSSLFAGSMLLLQL